MKIISYAIDETYLGCGTRNEIRKELGIDVDTVLKNL